MMSLKAVVLLSAFVAGSNVVAFSPGRSTISQSSTSLMSTQQKDNNNNADSSSESDRRSFLSKTLITTLPYLLPLTANAASVPVQRAVGSAEKKCRDEGNCLETLDIDGAVGWQWGASDRCDATDPMCGSDGRLREEALRGKPVPDKVDGLEITDVIELTMTVGVGSNADTQTLKMGLYGNQCPELVKELTDMCGKTGLITSQNLLLGAPVKLGNGCGSLTYIRPEERCEFGVFSQRIAYAKSLRVAKAPEEFVPQPRPSGKRLDAVRGEQSSRSHDVAGLISVPKDGIGYGSGLMGTKDDEAYASAFQITASSVPAMDKEGRKVIGQLFDSSSMDLLARLAGSPTRKMIPGQNGGTPLIKTTVDDCAIYSVSDLVAKE